MLTKVRNKQYHEIDRIELVGSRIAARASAHIRNRIIVDYKNNKGIETDVTEDLISSILLPLLSASIVADLKGRKRSFLQADESFNLVELQPELQLAHKDNKDKSDKKFKRHLKRVFKLPVKRKLKEIGVRVSIEQLPEKAQKRVGQARKIISGGKRLKTRIQKIPKQQVGKKARVKKVPEHPILKSRKKFRDKLHKEHVRIKQEIRQKIKKEKKYIYDEIVRHLRIILKDVVKETVKVVNWQEILDRLNNQQRSVKDIKSLINIAQFEESTEKILTKLVNKVDRKIRDKKERAKEEIKEKAIKEGIRAVREYAVKPVTKPIKQRIEEKIFGRPRKAGSHREYRSQYYYIAKTLQELERGQKLRRKYEIAKHISNALGGIADLVGFLSEYNIKDVFVFLTELGGASFFPETYKIGGIVKAANYIGSVADILEEDIEEYAPGIESYTKNRVKEYQIKRVLRLIQELQTIKKLFSRYYPPVYNILQNASQKTNDNLREVINNLILQGASTKHASKVLTEAFKVNGLDISQPYKIETIFRTQSALAYSAGRWQSDQAPAIQEILWGYKYITVGDSRVRPSHRILDGVTLPKDDPFWLYFWPPNGWNCRCSVISIFEPRELVYPGEGFRGLEDIDKDFTFNPGLVFTDAYARFAGE